MPDIFDEVEPTQAQAKQDIFDAVEGEREDLRRQMREARAEGIGGKVISGLADLGERAAYTLADALGRADVAGITGNILARQGVERTPTLLRPEDIGTLGRFVAEGLHLPTTAPVEASQGVVPDVLKGAKEFATEMGVGLSDPGMIALGGAATKAPREIGRLFQLQMAGALPQSLQEAAVAETLPEAVKGGLGVAANVAFPALIERGLQPQLKPVPAIPGRAMSVREGAKPHTPERQAALAAEEQLPPGEALAAPPTTKLSPEAEQALAEAEAKPAVPEPAPKPAKAAAAEPVKSAEPPPKPVPSEAEGKGIGELTPDEAIKAGIDRGDYHRGLEQAFRDGKISQEQFEKFYLLDLAELWPKFNLGDQVWVSSQYRGPAKVTDIGAGWIEVRDLSGRKSRQSNYELENLQKYYERHPEQRTRFETQKEPTPPPAVQTVSEGKGIEITPELGNALRDTFSDKNKSTSNLPVDIAEEYTYRGVVDYQGRTLYAYIRKGVNRGPKYQFNRPETIELYDSEQAFGVPQNRTKAVAIIDSGTVLTPRIYEAQSTLAGEPKQVSRSPVVKDPFTSTPAESPRQPPPQPSAGIEVKPTGAEGKKVPVWKVSYVDLQARSSRRPFFKQTAFSEGATRQEAIDRVQAMFGAPKYGEFKASKAPEGTKANYQFEASKSELPTPPTVGEPKPAQAESQGMGGAVPTEFTRGQGSPTAMKYRLIDQERRKRGLEPLSKPDRISDQATMDKAIAAMDQNPNLPDQLIKELREKPRAIEDWENHVLLLRKIELREEYHKAAREAMQAYADSVQFPERLADMAAANARTQYYSERLTELEQASRFAGTARGRALRALRVMANEDFSLATLEMEKRAANNWRELTPDERGQLIRIADEHKAKSEELQKRLDELEKAQQDKEVGTVLTNLKAEAARDPRAAATPVDVSAAKIRKRLEKNPNADIRFFVRKIARYFVSQGTKERDVLIDQVHGVLSSIIPDLERRTTMDLISGYGDYSRLPKDTVSVILRDLSGQMQQIAKLEDMMGGEAPLRSGQERRTPSDVERILQKQVEEQKKKGGYTVTDPETQLRTAQQAVQKRLENQIKDLELQIQTRQKIIKNPTKLQYDAKSNQLKARRDELKAVYDEIFAKPPKTEAERLAEWKERTTDRIAELKEFLAGTKQPKQRPTPVVLDKEALRIRFDLHTIERVWREKLYKDKLSQQATVDKVIRGGKEVLNVPRALLASYDLSAPGRQGIIIGLAHPIRASKALKPMFEAWHSEKGAFKAAEELRNRDNAPLYEIAKLYLAEHGGRLSAQEEVYMSRWAQKIPGVRKSERAYVTYLNRLRADSFDAMVKGLTVNGKGNPAELKAIANFINVATGRGTGLERYAETLNTTFFAPRYVASRFQFLLGQPFYRGTAQTRALVAKEYGRFLAGAAVVYALAMSVGAEVEHDWRSSDFGKIRIGDTRIDPMAGLVQNSTFIGRTLTGETKTLKGKVHPLWPASKVPFNRDNWFDVITRFGRSKLAPVPGNVVNLVLGQNVIGQKVTPADVAVQSVTPISWRDVYQNMVDNGVPAGMAMGILSIFGIGVNTYDQQNRR